MTKRNTRFTIVIPCHEPWDRSADFLRQTALRLSQGHSVVMILNYQGKFWFTALWQKIFHKTADAQPTAPTDHITFSTPVWLFPGRRWLLVRTINQKIWWGWLWLQLNIQFPTQKIWLWLFSPEDWLYPTMIPVVHSLYDCVDDHTQLEASETKRLKHQEKILIKTATVFTTNSHVLAELHTKLRTPDAIVVQGFDDVVWPKTLPTTPKTIHPQLLLMGSLDERVDWSLLIELAKKLPQHQFNLAGPIADRVTNLAQTLLRLPNVQYHGVLPRKELHRLLTQATLCLIPYQTTLPAAKHSFPMKVLEYFAYGKPVIASDITELNRYSPYVKIARTQSQWLSQIKNTTQKSWPKKLQIEARQIAWSHRYEFKLAEILQLLHRRV